LHFHPSAFSVNETNQQRRRLNLGMTARAEKLITIICFLVSLSMLLALAWVPTVGKNRNSKAAMRNACINNLRQIDGAVMTWQLENPSLTNTTPTWSDVVGETSYIRVQPACPKGGVYTLPAPGQKPKCSVAGHSL
jgi:hypothetical protein